MSREGRRIQLGRSNELLPEGTHICLLFDDEEERRVTLARFVTQGLCEGDHVRYLADRSSADEVSAWVDEELAQLGLIPKEPASLRVDRASDVYCAEGRFDPDRMLGVIAATYRGALAAGNPGARFTGEMTWALRGVPGSERLAEYESRINGLLDDHPASVVCQYDARAFSGATILDILRVHPMMLVRGQIVHNPYYTTSAELLAQRQSDA